MDAMELKLCDIQGRLFELFTCCGYDAESLVKEFMTSDLARDLDSEYNRMQWAGEEYLLEELLATCKINAIEGFDPSQFAIEYTDLKTNETRKYLPVVIRLAWFRLKYEKGKVSVRVEPEGEGFVATAKG